MARRNLRVLLLSLLVCLVCAPKASRSTRILWYAMHQIESRYLAPIEERQLFEGAMTGMTMTLDDYSTYIAPAILEDFNEQIDREFGGVGIEIRVDSRTKYLTVASPLVDTPAHASGIRAGDRIERIDDESTQGLSIEDAAERLRGRPGEPVTLTILPKGAKQARDVRLVRAVIHIDTVVGDTRAADGSWSYLLKDHPQIACLRINSFGDQTGAQMRRVVSSVINQGMKGLIIDLRDNPGGLLPAAIEVCDMFLDPDGPPTPGPGGQLIPAGLIVTTRDRNGRVLDEHRASGDGTIGGFPIAVLVNQASASASEIVAACLQDHQKAAVFGERSFGKGTVQEILNLHPDQGVLKLTTASYWRPSGRDINRREGAEQWGVSPDEGCEIRLSDQELADLQLARRIRDVAESYDSEELADESIPAFRDRQREAAIAWIEKRLKEG